MNGDDFFNIERRLDIFLPASYKCFLSAYPIEANADIRRHALFSNPGRVVWENAVHRTKGWFGIKWPREYFVIGDDGGGDTYFMVVGKDERVYFADHNAGAHPVEFLEACLSSDSLQDHMKKQLKGTEEEEKRRERQRRRENKKWWEAWK